MRVRLHYKNLASPKAVDYEVPQEEYNAIDAAGMLKDPGDRLFRFSKVAGGCSHFEQVITPEVPVTLKKEWLTRE